MGKRRGGLKTGGINESDGDEVLFLVGKRLWAQAYDRLGLFMGAMSMGLKIHTSRSCELADVSELELNLSEKIWISQPLLKNPSKSEMC